MAKFDIVRKKLETKHPGVTLVRISFDNKGKYAAMYMRSNIVISLRFRTLQDVIDQFDLDD